MAMCGLSGGYSGSSPCVEPKPVKVQIPAHKERKTHSQPAQQKKKSHSQKTSAPGKKFWPIANRFVLNEVRQMGEYSILKVTYEDCKNYDGKKILVCKAQLEEVINQGFLDPHFLEGNMISPIARFVPTVDGWKMAKDFVAFLNRDKS